MSVSIAARAFVEQRQAEAGLIGRVFRQDPKRGLVFIDQVKVPITNYGSDHVSRMASLEAADSGRYLLQLSLPNGQVMTENFDVSRGKETKLVVNLPHEGPHEWSTLQALTGQFDGMSLVAMEKGADGGGASPRHYADLRQEPESGFQLRFIVLGTPQTQNSILHADTLQALAALVGRDAAVEDIEDRLGTGREVITPAQEDGEFALFEFSYQGSIPDGAQRQTYHFGSGDMVPRAYLLEKSARGGSLIALPVPWTSYGNEIEVQLMLNKWTVDKEPEYTLTIGDPMINSALGYVKNGALKEAAQLIGFSAAQDLLFHKMSSPLAATVGGYLLVLGLDRSAYKARSDAWREWVDNLCNWFPWLPDGAILKAAKYFVLGDKDRDGALEALMTAYDRGLPFFTFGLNLMLEGMRRFANEGEPVAKERLGTLETLASVTNPEHNFLALNVSRHWQSEGVHERTVLTNA